MKQVLKLVLLWLCVAVSLTGCAEKVPMPEDGNDFGITVEQLEEGLEKERVFRVEGLKDLEDFKGEQEPLEFRKKEIEGIEKYTAKNGGVTLEVFCAEGKIYCVKLAGDIRRTELIFIKPNIAVYGEDVAYLLNRDWHSPRTALPDQFDVDEKLYMFEFSDGEVKDIQGEGIVYHAERKGNHITMVFTPTENRKELGENF